MTRHPHRRNIFQTLLFFSIILCFQAAALSLSPAPDAAAAEDKLASQDKPASQEAKPKRAASSRLVDHPGWINAEAKRRKDRLSEAVVIYLDLIKPYPEEVRLRAALADTLNRLNQNEEALLHINTAKSLAPYNPDVILLRGRILERLKRFEEAEREYRGLIQLDPDSRHGLFHLAAVLRKRGKLKEARPVLNRLLKNWPRWPELLYESAVCAAEAEDWTRARKDLDLAQRLGFDEVDPLVRLKIDIKRRN